MQCKYCQKLTTSENAKRQHEIRCKSNPSKIKILPSYGMKGKKGTNQFTKASREGEVKPVVTNETKRKILETRLRNGTLFHREETKKKISNSIKLAIKKNPEAYTSSNRGRAKQIIHDGIKFIGRWEIIFYDWAKTQGLKPIRPVNGFQYEWNGNRTYYPDFYIESLDLYVEVKGYETDRDRAKWSQFPKTLYIIKEREIDQIKRGCFVGLTGFEPVTCRL